jgi:hypothetical protein
MEQTEKIEELAKALSAFQGEVTAVSRDSENPFYKSKYADLATIIEHVKVPLQKNGLSVVQLCETFEGKVRVTSQLMHSSGQWIRAMLEMTPAKSDPQGVGSAITYARRYSLSAILNIASEEDDDGNEATKPKAIEKQQNKPVPPPLRKEPVDTKPSAKTTPPAKEEVPPPNDAPPLGEMPAEKKPVPPAKTSGDKDKLINEDFIIPFGVFRDHAIGTLKKSQLESTYNWCVKNQKQLDVAEKIKAFLNDSGLAF